MLEVCAFRLKMKKLIYFLFVFVSYLKYSQKHFCLPKSFPYHFCFPIYYLEGMVIMDNEDNSGYYLL